MTRDTIFYSECDTVCRQENKMLFTRSIGTFTVNLCGKDLIDQRLSAHRINLASQIRAEIRYHLCRQIRINKNISETTAKARHRRYIGPGLLPIHVFQERLIDIALGWLYNARFL